MKYLFIGSLYNEDDIDLYTQLGSKIDYPAHRFQSALIDGLIHYCVNIDIITSPNISSFPKIKSFIFKSKTFKIQNVSSAFFTGFLNLPFIKLFSKYIRIRRKLQKMINKNEKYIIFVYGIHSPFLLAVHSILNTANIKTCLIVPDLPEYMSDSKNYLYIIAKRIDRLLINKCIKKINSFVLLSPYMKNKLRINDKPYVQVEGIYKPEISTIIIDKEKFKTLLYTGNLDKRYGIIDLLNAFSLIEKENYRLWICGTGDSLDIIKQFESNDSRISYLGTFSKNEIYILQRKATLLINPRHSFEEYTKYSFPSKTMEYLASGTPTLMCHLPCIPTEYDDYIFYFDDESVVGMKNKILEVCEMEQNELSLFGSRASNFIINNKSSIVQSKKIIDLISKI